MLHTILFSCLSVVIVSVQLLKSVSLSYREINLFCFQHLYTPTLTTVSITQQKYNFQAREILLPTFLKSIIFRVCYSSLTFGRKQNVKKYKTRKILTKKLLLLILHIEIEGIFHVPIFKSHDSAMKGRKSNFLT